MTYRLKSKRPRGGKRETVVHRKLSMVEDETAARFENRVEFVAATDEARVRREERDGKGRGVTCVTKWMHDRTAAHVLVYAVT